MLKTDFTWLPPELPKKKNFCKHNDVQCGFFVAWWMEDEIRAASGEGFYGRKQPKVLGDQGARVAMHNLFKTLHVANKQILADLAEECAKVVLELIQIKPKSSTIILGRQV